MNTLGRWVGGWGGGDLLPVTNVPPQEFFLGCPYFGGELLHQDVGNALNTYVLNFVLCTLGSPHMERFFQTCSPQKLHHILLSTNYRGLLLVVFNKGGVFSVLVNCLETLIKLLKRFFIRLREIQCLGIVEHSITPTHMKGKGSSNLKHSTLSHATDQCNILK